MIVIDPTGQVHVDYEALSPTEATFLLREGNRSGRDRTRLEDMNAERYFGDDAMPMVGLCPAGDWPNDLGWRAVSWPGDSDHDRGRCDGRNDDRWPRTGPDGW